MTVGNRIDNPGTPVLQGNVWVFPNGRTVPLVRGAATEEEGGDGAPAGTITVTPPQQQQESKTFTEDDIAAARRQEKDKLYGELDKEREQRKALEERMAELQKNIEAFNTDKEAQLAAEREAQEAAEAERRAREESEMEAKDLLAKREQEWEQRLQETENRWAQQFEEIQQQAAAQEAMLEKERAFNALNEYKTSKIQEAGDAIMPHLHRYITGNTTEEIDASISAAMQTTSDMMEDMAQATAMQRGPRGVPATGASPTGPMENQASQQHLTSEDIRNMSMEQYEQLRPQLLSQARPQ